MLLLLQLLHSNAFHVAVMAVKRHRASLRKVPGIEDVKFAKVYRDRRASQVADGNRVGRFVHAVFYCVELFDLTHHAGPLFVGEWFEVY